MIVRGSKLRVSNGCHKKAFLISAGITISMVMITGWMIMLEVGSEGETPEANSPKHAAESTFEDSAANSPAETSPTRSDTTLIASTSNSSVSQDAIVEPDVVFGPEIEAAELPPSELASMMDPEYYANLADPSAKLVLVDISEQCVWAFEGENVVMEGSAVTGLKDRYDTQLGVYDVIVKRQNYTMRGSYGRAKVQYWMRFNNAYAQGFHDASWRGSFGDEIYATNGSHGCVNLPLDFAAELYNFVEIKTPVIVQE